MKTRLIVTSFIEKDGKILMGQKPPGVGPYPDVWHNLGGGVELEKETVDEAMKREVKEETNLDVDKLERVGFDEDYTENKHGEMCHYVFLIYKVTPTNMDAKAGDDIIKVKWFEKSEIKNLPLTTPAKKYIKKSACYNFLLSLTR